MGLIEVFGEVFQDIAALQNIELLPWRWYGLAAADESAAYSETELIDQLASISSSADGAAMIELQRLTAADDRLRVPAETISQITAADLASYDAK